MDNSQSPWVEIKLADPGIRYQHEDPGKRRKFPWQAMFACQIGILPFKEREKLKWGFTPAFLIEEAIDRQKLFVESQLSSNPIDQQNGTRTLALRCTSTPGAGLRLGLVAKILAASQAEAHAAAIAYCQELVSVFPYDYVLRPGTTVEEFRAISGSELLERCNSVKTIAQLRRFEKPLHTTKGLLRLVGIWQTNLRSDEQIWRALAGYPKESLFNISIQPTTLLEGERRALLATGQAANSSQDESPDEPYLQNYETWIDRYISRHLSPWNRYFYVQIHLAAPQEIDEFVFRSIGSSITREIPDKSSPGYQVISPPDNNTAIEWRNYLANLEFIHVDRSLLLPRLSELADLEETHAVFRFPYPPGEGLPGVEFLEL